MALKWLKVGTITQNHICILNLRLELLFRNILESEIDTRETTVGRNFQRQYLGQRSTYDFHAYFYPTVPG